MNRSLRFPRPRRAWACVGIFFVAVILIFSGPMKKRSIWLSPSEARKMTDQPDESATLEYRVINRVPLLKRWFYGRPLTVKLEAIILTAPATVPAETGLGQPMATNSSGVRLWMVAPANVPEFYAKFRAESYSNAAYTLDSRPRITMANGTTCSCTSRQLTYTGTYSASWSPPPPQDDIEIDMTPTRLPDSFKLTVAMRMIAPTSCTDSPFGFRLKVPNLGIVAVDCGTFKNRLGKRYWLLLAPTDASLNALILN